MPDVGTLRLNIVATGAKQVAAQMAAVKTAVGGSAAAFTSAGAAAGASARGMKQAGTAAGVTAVGMQKVGDQGGRLAGNFGKMTKNALKARVAFLAVGGAMAGMGVVALGGIKAAIDFEQAFVGVRKTVNATEAEFQRLSDGIRQMARETPIAATELAKIAEIAGQLGIGIKDIQKFTQVIAELGVTTDLSTEQAAFGLARLINVMGEAKSAVDPISDALVGLGNSVAATESEILDLGTQIAAVAAPFGVATDEVLGMAAAVRELGQRPQAAASAIGRAFANMEKAIGTGGDELAAFTKITGTTSEEFANLLANDPTALFVRLVDGIAQVSKEGGNLSLTLEDLDLHSIRVSRVIKALSQNVGVLKRDLFIANKEMQLSNARTIEFGKFTQTAAARIKIMFNNLKDLGIEIGTSFLPAVKGGADSLANIFNLLRGGVPLFVALGKALSTIVPGLTVLLALKLGVRGVILVFGILRGIVGGLLAQMGIFTAKSRAAAIALSNLGGATTVASTGMMRLRGIVAGVIGILSRLGPLIAILGFTKLIDEIGKAERAADSFNLAFIRSKGVFEGLDGPISAASTELAELEGEIAKIVSHFPLPEFQLEIEGASVDELKEFRAALVELEGIADKKAQLEFDVKVRGVGEALRNLKELFVGSNPRERARLGESIAEIDRLLGLIDDANLIRVRDSMGEAVEMFEAGVPPLNAMESFFTALHGENPFKDIANDAQEVAEEIDAAAEALQEFKKSTLDVAGSFEMIMESEQKTANDLLASLDDNLGHMTDFFDNLLTIARRGFPRVANFLKEQGVDTGARAAREIANGLKEGKTDLAQSLDTNLLGLLKQFKRGDLDPLLDNWRDNVEGKAENVVQGLITPFGRMVIPIEDPIADVEDAVKGMESGFKSSTDGMKSSAQNTGLVIGGVARGIGMDGKSAAQKFKEDFAPAANDINSNIRAITTVPLLAALGAVDPVLAGLIAQALGLETGLDDAMRNRSAHLQLNLSGLDRFERALAIQNQLGGVPLRSAANPPKKKKAPLHPTFGEHRRAHGGVIPNTVPRGPFNFGPKGTDTVPAWLTPGEFVVSKPAVDKLGVPFLSALNQGGKRGGDGASIPGFQGGGFVDGGGFLALMKFLGVFKALDIRSMLLRFRSQQDDARRQRKEAIESAQRRAQEATKDIAFGGGGMTVMDVTFNISGREDAETLARKIRDKIVTLEKRSPVLTRR